MDKKTRIEIPAKPVHPLGYACEDCLHVVKDTAPGSRAMKCVRYPPRSEAVKQQGQIVGWMSISPPVQVGEWCGEFGPVPPAANG